MFKIRLPFLLDLIILDQSDWNHPYVFGMEQGKGEGVLAGLKG